MVSVGEQFFSAKANPLQVSQLTQEHLELLCFGNS